MTNKKSVRPKFNSNYSTVLILWQLDYYENGGVTRNQLHHMAEHSKFDLYSIRTEWQYSMATEDECLDQHLCGIFRLRQ